LGEKEGGKRGTKKSGKKGREKKYAIWEKANNIKGK